MLALYIAGDGLHRPRTVEGDGGDDVLEVLRAHVGQKLLHARGFKLEHAVRVALGDHFVHAGVVEGNIFALKGLRARLDGHGDRVHDDVERAQAEKVHFQKPQRLERAHGELGGDHVVVGLQRHVVDHRLAGDEHAGGVGGGVARHAFEFFRRVDDLAHAVIALVEAAQLRGEGKGALQRHAQFKGHQFGDAVRFLIGHVHHPAHVADDGAGGHGAEGDDLRHVIRAVAAAHVVDHLPAALVVEVHVDIRHGNALGIEEALKEQIVLDGVDGGDAQAVGDDGTRAAAAPRPHAHAVGARVVDKIPDDEEIIHIAHAGDDAQFVFHALARVLAALAVALPEALFAQAAQIGERVRLALGQGEFRQVRGGEIELHVAARGDLRRVFDGVREVGEEGAHLRLALDVEFARGHLHAVGVGERLARLDAHQHFLRLSVIRGQVVAVVGNDQGDVHLPRQFDQARQHLLFLGDAVILQFHEEIAPAEDVQIFLRHLPGFVVAPVEQKFGQVAGKAGGEGDEAAGVLFQQFVVHARAVVKAAREALGDEAGEVFVALVVLAEQNEVGILAKGGLLFVHVRADVHLAADDGMDAGILAGAVKVHHAVHHAVVGNGAGVHAQLPEAGDEGLDGAGAVQEAVFRVQVQVCKHLSSRYVGGGEASPESDGRNPIAAGSAQRRGVADDAVDLVGHVVGVFAGAYAVGQFVDRGHVAFLAGHGHGLDGGIGLAHGPGHHLADALGRLALIGVCVAHGHQRRGAGHDHAAVGDLGDLVDGRLYLGGVVFPVKGRGRARARAVGQAGLVGSVRIAHGARAGGGARRGRRRDSVHAVARVHAAGEGKCGDSQQRREQRPFGKSHICIPPCANILRNRNANKPSAGNSRDGKTCESRAAR